MSVPVRRRRTQPWRRRLTRPFRRLAAVSKLRLAIVAAMVLAAAGGGAAAAVLLSGPSPAAPPPGSALQSAPPLAPGPHGLRPVPLDPARGVPFTVRLVVPSVGIDLAVVQGDGVSVPLNLAAHYPGTDQPGGGSNALYYAHARPGMFQALYRLHNGDVIQALRADGTQVEYHVAALEYVPYNDDAVLTRTPYDQITLLTCTSYDPYTPRFIVIGLPGAS